MNAQIINDQIINAMHSSIEKLAKQLNSVSMLPNIGREVNTVTLRKVDSKNGFKVCATAKVNLKFYAEENVTEI